MWGGGKDTPGCLDTPTDRGGAVEDAMEEEREGEDGDDHWRFSSPALDAIYAGLDLFAQGVSLFFPTERRRRHPDRYERRGVWGCWWGGVRPVVVVVVVV